MRVAEWHHYRRFAMEEIWEVCPRCAYSLDGLADERCPECGEDLVKLRRTLSRRRSEWL
jgi:anaerobic ribonucleoside-triphosphate reductase